MAAQVIGQILEQRYALDLMTSNVVEFEKISLLVETNYATYNMILSIEYTLSRQRELETITDDQESLSEKIEALKESFNNIIITLGEEKKTLWELGQIGDAHCDLFTENEFIIDNIASVRSCVRTCTDFCGSFQDLVPFADNGNPDPMPFTTMVKSFLSNTTFGSIDQLRVELETAYKGVQITLTSDDGKDIDCMFLPGLTEDESHEGREEMELPTIIYCSPNAFLYEVFQHENDWLDFYRNLGINMFVWNYRSYGRSQGSVGPSKMYEDAEMIVDYLRQQRGITNSKTFYTTYF